MIISQRCSSKNREGANMPMRNLAAFFLCVTTMSVLSKGQQPRRSDLSGDWLLTADLYGTSVYERMELKQDGSTGFEVTFSAHLLVTSDTDKLFRCFFSITL